jgi:hypothetical protein
MPEKDGMDGTDEIDEIGRRSTRALLDATAAGEDVDGAWAQLQDRLAGETLAPVAHGHRGRGRWAMLAVGAAAAAALVAVVAVVADDPATIRQAPADTPSTVPENVGPPVTTGPATSPSTSAPDSGVTAVSEIGWDGDGSACITLDGATGCFPGGTITTDGDTVASVIGATGTWSVDATWDDAADGADVVTTVSTGGPACIGGGAAPPSVWMIDVSCAEETGALWGALPSIPEGTVGYQAAVWNAPGAPIELTLLTDEVVDGVPRPGFQLFETTFELPSGLPVHCLLAVPDDGGGWAETCAPSPNPWATYIVPDDRGAIVVDATGDSIRLVALGDGAMWTNGCDDSLVTSLAEAGAHLTMATGVACDGDVAYVSFGPVFVQEGPPDGGLSTYERSSDGVWHNTDSGTGIRPAPQPLPIPPAGWAPVDEFALTPEIATDEVRAWVEERPGFGVVDAVVDAVTQPEIAAPTVTGPAPDLELYVVETGLLDDSVGRVRYAIWLQQAETPSESVLLAVRQYVCSRGVPQSDGEALCV